MSQRYFLTGNGFLDNTKLAQILVGIVLKRIVHIVCSFRLGKNLLFFIKSIPGLTGMLLNSLYHNMLKNQL